MKVVQLFKIYNFHVMQIFTRSKDLKIFSKMQKNFIPLRKTIILIVEVQHFWAKMQQCHQSIDY